MPHLLTLEEAAEFERQQRQWELTSPHNPDSPCRGRPITERRWYVVNHRDNHRENFEEREMSRSSTPDLKWYQMVG